MRRVSALFIALFLISCNSSLVKTKEPLIQFETPNIPDQLQNYELDLNVGIFAFNENIIFLFGQIGEFSTYPIQSTILRSEDGGQHWTEVMKPERTSAVLNFQILESGIGWAMLQVKSDNLGEITLFQTMDMGKSWKRLTQLHKDTALGFPNFMHFANEQDGQIDIIYPYEQPGYIKHLSTYNGGQTWEDTGIYQPKFENYSSQSNITGAYVSNTKDFTQSESLDGRSLWKINSTNTEVLIYRKLPKPEADASGFITWQDWETIISLPVQLSYQNGMLLLP